MTSLQKSVPQREHKERSQLRSRKKYGLLEKKKDYVLRARDFQSKKKRLKALRQRTMERNPDEFYFAMEHQRTRGGVHIEKRNEKYSEEFLKLLKTQDLNYITHQRDINRKKIEKLKSVLHLGVGVSDDVGASNTDSGEPGTSKGPRHTIFVDDEKEVKDFDAAKYFDTVPELVNRTFNRPRIANLSNELVPVPKGNDKKKLAKEREKLLLEYKSRLERDEMLKNVEQEMNIQKALMGKGRRKKVGEDSKGLPVYKWLPERKK